MPEGRPARRKLRTVGDLRAILAQAIDDVIAGEMDVHAASAVVKLASAINASLVAEIEVARFALAQTNNFTPIGALSLESSTPESPPTIEAEPLPEQEPAPKPLTPSPAANALVGAAAAIQSAKVARQPALAQRVIDRRPSGFVDLGTPAPGRSALDQRHGASAV